MPIPHADDDQYAELTPEQLEAKRYEYQLRDTQRRIDNILDAYPLDDWTPDEARAMLAALSGMVRVPQGDGVVGVTVTITSQSGGPDIEVSTHLPRPEVK
jgi:hypothetical protein